MRPRVLATVAALGLVVVGLVAVAPVAAGRARVETPDYTLESDEGDFVIRRYEPRIVAEVTVEGSGKQAANAGFRVLADFIFGNNEARTKVAMTAPVDRRAETIEMTAPVDRSAGEGEDRWVVAFTMPSKYTLETLPKPKDSRVSIREVPATRYAVLRFSGAPAEAKVQRKITAFVAEVEAAGFTPKPSAAPIYARYDPPWTLPLLRRNEILVELVDGE